VNKKTAVCFGIFLIGMYALFLNPYLDVRGYNAHDSAVYMSRAISLWKGIGYGEQFADVFMPVTGQPPVFSFLLAPIIGIFGVNFFILKMFMLSFAALLSVALYKFFAYFCQSKEQAVCATFLMIASPVIFGLSHRVLADIPLFVFVVWGLWNLDHYFQKSVPIFSPWLIFAVIASSTAYLLKQTALAVFVGAWFLFLHPTFRNKTVLKKLLIFTAISSIPIVIWHAWCSTVPDDLWYWTTPATRDYLWKNPFTAKDGYISVADFIIRVRHNLVWGISNNVAMIFFAPFYFLEGSLLGFLLSVPIVLWLGWQWTWSFIKRPSVLEGFVFFSLALLVPKYLGMAARYIAIIWPALLVYAIRGAVPFPKKIQTYLLNSLILISLCTTFIISLDQWKNPYGSKTLKDYVAIASQARKLLPAESVCKAPLVPHWQILTGHKCQYQGQDLVTYFVSLSDQAPQNLGPYKDVERDALEGAKNVGMLWENRKSELKKVFQNNTFALFKVVNHGD